MNWFSEYNLVPKGMCLKLHLLSGEAITNYEYENYLAYNKQKFLNKFTLSSDQRKIFEEISKKNKVLIGNNDRNNNKNEIYELKLKYFFKQNIIGNSDKKMKRE